MTKSLNTRIPIRFHFVLMVGIQSFLWLVGIQSLKKESLEFSQLVQITLYKIHLWKIHKKEIKGFIWWYPFHFEGATTFSIKALCLMTNSISIWKCDTQCFFWVSLCWVSLCWVSIMLSVYYAECRCADCLYADCLYAECRGASLTLCKPGTGIASSANEPLRRLV